MKKTINAVIAASVLATPAMATNMENPMYMPGAREFYSKLSNGLMLKVADDSSAHKDKNHDGKVEFPIIRIQEELGFGITDRWAVHGSVQYTHDNDIGRTGLSAGRIGTTYRVLNLNNGFMWDIYGDLHLGGVGEMRGQYNISGKALSPMEQAGLSQILAAQGIPAAQIPAMIAAYSLQNASGVIDYDNYSNGMWGVHIGTKFGRVWNNKLTTSAFVEVLRTFGDDNSRIRIVGNNTPVVGTNSTAMILAAMYAPSEVTAEFKSTTEVNAGANVFYQWTDVWSTGAWFRYNHHADQGIKKITTQLAGAQLNAVKSELEKKLADMNDGFDEYIVGMSVAAQMTDHAQVALYGEYTFDTAHDRSQNGTDVKVEAGVRLNFRF